jgi:hypothetical protein
VPAINRLETVIAGANVALVDGTIADAGEVVARLVRGHGWFDASTMRRCSKAKLNLHAMRASSFVPRAVRRWRRARCCARLDRARRTRAAHQYRNRLKYPDIPYAPPRGADER